MIATVLDTQTHRAHVIEDVWSYQWAEGTYACDCNRWPPGEEFESKTCQGHKRFIVIKAEFDHRDRKFTLPELNRHYLPALLREHGVE
jgi:hypothetical protein